MFYIIEIQTNGGVGAVSPVQTATTRNQAMSIYHTILASASISEVEYHSCIVVDEQGQYLARECFKHPRPPQGGEES